MPSRKTFEQLYFKLLANYSISIRIGYIFNVQILGKSIQLTITEIVLTIILTAWHQQLNLQIQAHRDLHVQVID